MELELKHIAPYLPYGVKFIRYVGYGEIETLTTKNLYTVLNQYNTHVVVAISETKQGPLCNPLILRPLSDLTKEIEHNGEKFVPMLKLYEIAWGRTSTGNDFDFRNLPENGYCATNLDIQNATIYRDGCFYNPCDFDGKGNGDIRNQLTLFQKLFEWHFNVFNLPEHLWIDINTI